MPTIQTVSINMRLSQSVAKVTENDTAERTEKESDAKGSKCGERSHRRAYLRENSRLNTSAAVMP